MDGNAALKMTGRVFGISLATAVALAASSFAGPAVAAPQSSGSVAASPATFTVAPPSGPMGTEIRVASVTPCAPPVGPGGQVVVRIAQFPVVSDAVPVYQPVQFPVRPDGSWSGSFPSDVAESGPVRLDASCQTDGGPPVIYAQQSFRQTPSGLGYWLATTAEIAVPCFCPPPGPPTNIAAFGDARYSGSPAEFSTAIPLVGLASTPIEGLGYWMVASDGGVFAFGDAMFFGSATAAGLRRPVVGMAATPTGRGYWLVASDGGVFAFGDAAFFGSLAAVPLNKPIVGMAAAPTGRGYWLVASDGGVFAFGDAVFSGSVATALHRPMVGVAPTPTGRGYWLVASDGGVFAFGDAVFSGSAAALSLNRPIVGIAATFTGRGYWLLGADGGIFTFGDATFHGSNGDYVGERGQPDFVALSATPATRPG